MDLFQPFLCLLLLPQVTLSAKILFLSFPVYSHLQNLATLAESMLERGHEAWITAPNSLQEKLQIRDRHMKAVPFSNPQKLDDALDDVLNKEDVSPIKQFWKTGTFPRAIEPTLNILDIMLTDELFMTTIGDKNFDLIVLDNTPIAQTLCIIPYKYNIPFIYLGVNYEPFSARIPFSTAFVPNKGLPLSDQMNFSERLQNTIFFAFLIIYQPFSRSNAVSIYAPEKPFVHVREIQAQAALHLIEWNIVLEYPAPTLPHVIQIGQIAPKHSKKENLPEGFVNFLERSKDGVVLVSFGSIAPTTKNDVLDKMVSAFEETKYNYIIKGSYSNSTDRNLVVDWIPQKLLLTHPKIKLFITHCGANGLAEAISNGVPMLGFPLFAEQPGNAHRVQSRGYGLTMNIFEASKDDIIISINELIDNPKYKTKVKEASEILKARNLDGLNEAVFWIEHVLKFGSDYLKSAGIDLPWYQYLLLDVLAFLLLCTGFVVAVIYFCLKCICRRCVKSKAKAD